jgi:8-oxo-dGTP diphosphatase
LLLGNSTSSIAGWIMTESFDNRPATKTSEMGTGAEQGEGERVDLRCSVLFFRGDNVLLCQRRDADNVWVLPGGTPHLGESTAAAARREVEEESGILVSAERVAFVLETSNWDRSRHLVEIVFLGAERDRSAMPVQREPNLAPSFLSVAELGDVNLRPPIAGYIKGFARSRRSSAPYLGNVWRPEVLERKR